MFSRNRAKVQSDSTIKVEKEKTKATRGGGNERQKEGTKQKKGQLQPL